MHELKSWVRCDAHKLFNIFQSSSVTENNNVKYHNITATLLLYINMSECDPDHKAGASLCVHNCVDELQISFCQFLTLN